MSFMIYDIVLLIIFLILASFFLYSRRQNLKKDGWLVLYRTKWGMKLIDYVGGKFTKTLHALSYFNIFLGYVLMAMILYIIGKIVYIYLAFPSVVQALKVPPLMPLLPYFTELPGLKGMFPVFYFVYFILAIIIVATVHEFAHGIFMKRYGVKIKSTGFAFMKYFPAFLGAFVEEDAGSMAKKRRFEQKAVLSAGVFANTLTAIFFFFIMWGFFALTFAPAGIVFNDYSYSVVNVSMITAVNGVAVVNPTMNRLVELSESANYNSIEAEGKRYVGIKGFSRDETQIGLYDDYPAINAQLAGAIIEMNGAKTTSFEDVGREMAKYTPGEKIIIKTTTGEKIKEYEITLGTSPNDPSKPWLGVMFLNQEGSVLSGGFAGILSSFKEVNVYYESQIGEIGEFIYNFFWWIALINILVALFNMLPIGGLDGGRFFYLTAWGITGKEKFARKLFGSITYVFLFIAVLLMLVWVWSLIK